MGDVGAIGDVAMQFIRTVQTSPVRLLALGSLGLLAVSAVLAGVWVWPGEAEGLVGATADVAHASETVSSAAFMAGALLVSAGPALMLSGSEALARLGWAMVLLGVLCPADALSRALDPLHQASLVGPATRLTGMVMCMTLILTATGVRAPRVRASVQGLTALGVLTAVFVVSSLAQLAGVGEFDTPVWTHVGLGLLTAVGWSVSALLVGRRGTVGRSAMWLLPAGLALAHLGGTIEAAVGRVDALSVAAGVSVPAAAVATAFLAWRRLAERVGSDRRAQERQTRELAEARSVAVEDADRLAGLTHDARNACAGVRAAVETMCRHDDRLDEASAVALRAAALSGLVQIEELLSRESEALVEADLMAVAHELTRPRRIAGADIEVRGDHVVAQASAGDVRRVLLNLLVNAERHGGGTPIRVAVDSEGQTARMTVSDAGPGVAAERRGDLFARGVRGAGSSGQGLGLHLARSLARTHGGDVRLVPTPTGSRFEVTLPLGGPARRPPSVALGGGPVRGQQRATVTVG